MERKIIDIFQEIDTWENAPINKILGDINVRPTQSTALTKRIIMFGATQVGKTTLIMTLLGIKNDCTEKLEKSLRGDDKAGSSSTSTFVVYSKSNKPEEFGLAYCQLNETIDEKKIKYYNASDFEKKIKEHKSKNRSNNQKKHNHNLNELLITYIYIPSSYFEDDCVENLQIVDSRGFGERDATTDDINYVINKMMPFSAGIVAVTSGEKIQSLESEYRPYLSQKSKNQVLLVTSHAISTSDEIKKGLKKQSDCIKAEEYIRLTYENKVKNIPGFHDYEGRIFPIETKSYLTKFGYKKFEEVVDIQRKRIMDAISEMQCKTSISICKDNIEVVTAKLNNEIILIENENEALLKKVEEEKMLLDSLKKRVDQLKKNNNKLENKKEKEKAHYDELIKKCKEFEDEEPDFIGDSSDFDGIKDDNRGLNKLISLVSSEMKDYYSEFYKDYSAQINEIIQNNAEYYYVNGIRFKHWWKDDNAEAFENASRDSFEEICEMLLKQLKSDKRNALKSQKSPDKSQEVNLSSEVTRREKSIEKSNAQIAENNEKIKQREYRINELVDYKNNLEQVFLDAFYEKKDELINKINFTINNEKKLAGFLTVGGIEYTMKDVKMQEKKENNKW